MEEAVELHRKLLSDLKFGFLDKRVNDGGHFKKWKDSIKRYSRDLPFYQCTTIDEDFNFLEEEGLLSVGQYDVLINIFNDIDKRAVSRIKKDHLKIQSVVSPPWIESAFAVLCKSTESRKKQHGDDAEISQSNCEDNGAENFEWASKKEEYITNPKRFKREQSEIETKFRQTHQRCSKVEKEFNENCAESTSDFPGLREIPLNNLLWEIGEKISAQELSKLKFLVEDLYEKSKLSKINTAHEFFILLKKSRRLTIDDLLLLQALLKYIRRDDLFEECKTFAQNIGQTLYFHKPKASPENGHKYAKIHIDGNLQDFKKSKLEETRFLLSIILGYPEEFIVLAGIEPFDSIFVTFMAAAKNILTLQEISTVHLAFLDMLRIRHILTDTKCITISFCEICNKDQDKPTFDDKCENLTEKYSTMRVGKMQVPDDQEYKSTSSYMKWSYIPISSLDKHVFPYQSLLPPKESSKRELEKTSRYDVTTQRRPDPFMSIDEVKGYLYYCVTDRKKDHEQSWKRIWAELREHAFYLFKEDMRSPTCLISIRDCILDIARHHTKKNVFGLNTVNNVEYLFHAENNDSMVIWMRALQINSKYCAFDKCYNEYLKEWEELLWEKWMCSHLSSMQLHLKDPDAEILRGSNKYLVNCKSLLYEESPSVELSDPDSILKRSSSSSKNRGNNEIFGDQLEDCLPSSHNDYVPMIVDLCTRIIEAKVLRKFLSWDPDLERAAIMVQEVFQKGIHKIDVDNIFWGNVNVICGVLLLFFERLSDPVCTLDLYDDFIKTWHTSYRKLRMLKVKGLLHQLPEHHFQTFKHLAGHLHRVSSYKYVYKIRITELGRLFGSVLIRRVKYVESRRKYWIESEIMENIILHNDWYFNSWNLDSYIPMPKANTDYEVQNKPSVSNISCDEEETPVSVKDIVSSTLQAAIKKMRKTSSPAIISDSNPSFVRERMFEKMDELEIKKSKKISQTKKISSDSDLDTCIPKFQRKQKHLFSDM